MSEFGDSDSPVFLGELRGYRKWLAGPHVYDGNRFGLKLLSVFQLDFWGSEPIVAKCHGGMIEVDRQWEPFVHGSSPDPKCTCGIYAFYGPNPRYLGSISGSIAASGTIIPGTLGFRAERARIEALVFEGRNSVTEGLRSSYPEVPIFPDWESLVKEFPPSDVPWRRDG